MKRVLRLGAVAIGAVALPGCPIFPADPYACLDDWDCAAGYACNVQTGNCEFVALYPDGPTRSNRGIAFCDSPDDCGRGETCTRAGVCAVGACDAAGYECVDGYRCLPSSTGWDCVPEPAGGGGAGGAAGDDQGGNAGDVPAAGAGGAPQPSDAGGAPPIAGAPLT